MNYDDAEKYLLNEINFDTMTLEITTENRMKVISAMNVVEKQIDRFNVALIAEEILNEGI